MAKNSSTRSGGPARIRLVVLDAEVADGDISSLTQALQNALRGPTTTVVQRVASSNGSKAIGLPSTSEDEVIEADEELEEEGVVDQSPRSSSKPRGPRKAPKAPDVIDIEMHQDVSFASFAEGKNVDSQAKKYLTAAAWLHEHRGIASVTDRHMYTCFRSIGWPTNIADFSQPLRVLKNRKFFTSPGRGQYAINHIGLDFVRKLGGGDGTV